MYPALSGTFTVTKRFKYDVTRSGWGMLVGNAIANKGDEKKKHWEVIWGKCNA